MDNTRELYDFIENYAKENKLPNTLLALPVTEDLLSGVIRRSYDFDASGRLNLTYFEHCLSATKMLIDLKVPVSREEQDILYASTLCHDMIENLYFAMEGEELVLDYHLDRRIYEIVRLVTRSYPMTEEEKREFFDGIAHNKLAVLVALADRGNLVEQLYSLSISEAMEYVREIRRYTLPLCIFAKEHYPDIQNSVNVLMEKIRCLIDVTDIISSRYQKQEMAYTNEMLSLMEENARIRGLIRQLKAAKENC